MFENIQKLDPERYGRPMLLSKWGVSSQQKLQYSNILLVGAGGLGATIALYLAGAGIGSLGIVDGDKIELSNLHRQIIHKECNIGLNKATSAAQSCKELNTTVKIDTYPFFLDNKSAQEIIPKYDVIIDGTDNPQSKYLLNDACVIYNKPLVCGSALFWEGQFTVFHYKNGPCYRCVYPHPPPSDTIQSCDLAGVMGPIPGLIGTLQALEALKICANLTENVCYGRLLIYDGLNAIQPWRSIQLRSKRDDCAVCGKNATITSLENYNAIIECPLNQKEEVSQENQICAKNFFFDYFQHLINTNTIKIDNPFIILDVRPYAHYNIVHLPNSVNWPFNDLLYEASISVLLKKCSELSTNLKSFNLIVICRKGNDSTKATNILLNLLNLYLQQNLEFNIKILNLKGGLKALQQYLPQFPFI